MEFIPGPFQILGRIRNAPDRWSKRIGALGLGSKVAPLLDDAAFYARTAFPGLKKAGLNKGAVMGTGKGLGKVLPITSQLFGAYEGTRRLIQGQPMHKVGLGYGYALPGPWGWANMAADLAVPGGASSSFGEEVPVTKPSITEKVDQFLSPKDAWLHDTRNSPAATATDSRGNPIWSDDERWELQQKHRAWKEKMGR